MPSPCRFWLAFSAGDSHHSRSAGKWRQFFVAFPSTTRLRRTSQILFFCLFLKLAADRGLGSLQFEKVRTRVAVLGEAS
jgi:hypothetical protein